MAWGVDCGVRWRAHLHSGSTAAGAHATPRAPPMRAPGSMCKWQPYTLNCSAPGTFLQSIT